jgi:TusA-related sulfurtransferase
MQLKVDLRAYRCPQLFVQFRFNLKQAQQQCYSVRFIYEHNQRIDDILAYLNTKQYEFVHCHNTDSFSYIEVNP